MEKRSDTIGRASSGFERFKWGCLWIVLNPLWIILLGSAAYLGLNSGEGESVTGTVASMRQVPATRPGEVSTYAPTVDYNVNGRKYTHHSSTSSFPPGYKVGDTVTVIYQTTDPNDAEIDSWSSRWLLPALLGGAGLVVAAVAVPLTLLSIRRRGRSRQEL
jgi:hypothetical protein